MTNPEPNVENPTDEELAKQRETIATTALRRIARGEHPAGSTPGSYAQGTLRKLVELIPRAGTDSPRDDLTVERFADRPDVTTSGRFGGGARLLVRNDHGDDLDLPVRIWDDGTIRVDPPVRGKNGEGWDGS